jgi:hypothetical protein
MLSQSANFIIDLESHQIRGHRSDPGGQDRRIRDGRGFCFHSAPFSFGIAVPLPCCRAFTRVCGQASNSDGVACDLESAFEAILM